MGEDILSRIVEYKKEAVSAKKKRRSEAGLRNEAEEKSGRRPFIADMETFGPDHIHIIAEIKRASPSKGDIRPDLDPADLGAAYAKGGASALSVLTEDHWFKGSIEDLQAARNATDLPVLQKDFFISEYQIFEAAVIGADAVLLIVRILSSMQLHDYLDICAALALDALVEVHTPEDIDLVRETSARLVGINNRNLKSFETDIRTASTLAGRLGPGRIPVAASGISSRKDIEQNLQSGIFHFLIGESLVRAEDPAGFLRELKAGVSL